MAAPVSPDPSATDTVEVRDLRAETGVSPHRLRHAVGRVLDVLILLGIDIGGITAAIYSGLVLREVLNGRQVHWDWLWTAEREWLPFDVITSRAFASLADFVSLTRGWLAPGGVWMAMKGRRPDDEIGALPADVEVFHVEPLTVPGLAAERCLVWMRAKPV